MATTQAALDRITSGVVLLDTRGGVTFANHSAVDTFSEGSALTMRKATDGGEHLVAANQALTAAIDRAIAGALQRAPKRAPLEVDHFTKGISILRPVGRSPLMLAIATLPSDNRLEGSTARAAAIVFITDAAHPLSVSDAMLKDLFKLTDAEITLVRALCTGHTLAETARERGLMIETVRTQLKSAFAKTQTHRQADLIRLLLGLASAS